jgi:pyruvate/2-oxoacid:ferredoxin oxidoreductase beta subunit
MTDHLRTLAEVSRFPISCFPNAGLPDEDGNYNELPPMLAKKIERFCAEGWINIIGGCCGTTPEHIRMIAEIAARYRPRVAHPPRRSVVSGLETLVIDQDTRPVIVGERTNVLGSRKFKQLIADGKVEEASGNYQEAAAHFRKAVDLDGSNVIALNNLAYVLASDSGRLDEAVAYARKARDAAPQSPEILDTLGWLYYKQGLYELAVTELERALSKAEWPVIQFHLGLAYNRLGKTAQGGRLLATALTKEPTLADGLLAARPTTAAAIAAQRERVDALRRALAGRGDPDAVRLSLAADALVPKSVWIVGGDGWAYDIGFGGLDHVLACGRDVNVLVLDTQVYSNTGGQASKATPRGAVAKFAAAGKPIGRKDLGLFATGYGNVYVAQIALGADNAQTVKALAEAETWPGPSLIIAYSTCIAHGIDMSTSMSHQAEAVKTGFWPLWRYDPRLAVEGQRPMQLDSRTPTLPLREFQTKEARFAMLARSRPERYAELQRLAQTDVEERRRLYEQLAGVERHAPGRAEDQGEERAPAETEGVET